MTNGTITKRIYKTLNDASTGVVDPKALQAEVERHLGSFPMSSHKLVYDTDQHKFLASVWDICIKACIASDNRKATAQNNWLKEMGVSPKATDWEFGRCNIKS